MKQEKRIETTHISGTVLIGNEVTQGKPSCPNMFTEPLRIVAPGKTEKEANDAFDDQVTHLAELLKKALQCDQYCCNEGKDPCSWAYFLDDNKTCKQVHVQPKNKPIWVCEQTGWAGCFCDDVF